MPTVPRYERQVTEQALPNVRVNTDASPEAFGGGASAQQVSAASQSLASKAQDYFVEQQRQANITAVSAAESKAQEVKTDLQLKTSQMLGQSAFGAPDVAAKEWKESTDKIRESLTNDAQKAAFDAKARDHWNELDRSVRVHTTSEYKRFADDSSKSNIALAQNSAVLNANDDLLVARQLDRIKGTFTEYANRNGIAEKNADGSENSIYQQGLVSALSKAHSGVIEARIEKGLDAQAVDYFEKNKASMSAEDQSIATKKIEAVKEVSENISAYQDLKQYKLSDGRTPDEAKMERVIMARTDLSNEKKLKMVQFVKAKAGNDHQNMLQSDKAMDESFKNSVIKLKKSGGSLEDALKKAPNFSYDENDQRLKEEFVRDMWAGKDVRSDPATLVALHDSIDEGTATKAQIDNAVKNKVISGSDWVSLRDKWHNSEIEGKNPEQKRANESVHLLAKEKFGSDKEGMDAFISEVYSSSQGKSAAEKVKIAQDKLKADESSVSRFWSKIPFIGGMEIPGTGQAQYKTDQEKRSANYISVGKFHQDLGVDTYKAIEQGAIRSGSKKSGPEAVNDLSIAFGGYDKIKPGTPVHNAIQSIMKHGFAPTEQRIRDALKRYPNGRF